jgi:hypothetical protein
MYIALDIQVVDLLDSQQEVSGRGQMGGGVSDESRNSAERVEAIYNVNKSFFLVGGFASTSLDRLCYAMDIVCNIAMRRATVTSEYESRPTMME